MLSPPVARGSLRRGASVVVEEVELAGNALRTMRSAIRVLDECGCNLFSDLHEKYVTLDANGLTVKATWCSSDDADNEASTGLARMSSGVTEGMAGRNPNRSSLRANRKTASKYDMQLTAESMASTGEMEWRTSGIMSSGLLGEGKIEEEESGGDGEGGAGGVGGGREGEGGERLASAGGTGDAGFQNPRLSGNLLGDLPVSESGDLSAAAYF
jgi:hypothetical protein